MAALAVLAMVAAAGPARATNEIDRVLGVRESRSVRLRIDWRPGEPLRVAVPLAGRPVVLDLAPHAVRSPRYAVYHVAADGTRRAAPSGPESTLRGSVLGAPGSFVAAAVIAGDLHARIELPGGGRYWVEPVAPHLGAAADPVGDLHVVYRAEDVIPGHGTCAANDARILEPALARAATPGGRARAPGGNLYLAELACDADFEYWQRWGPDTEARINAIIDQVNVQYEREVDITHEIVAVLIRTETTYTVTDPGALLNAFRNRWLLHHADIPRDVAHLFTGKDLDGSIIGIAFTGVVCSSNVSGFGFGLVQSDFETRFECVTDLTAHELGHNWGAFHCGCPEHTMNGFITCANEFSEGSIEDIVTFRDSRACLEEIPRSGYCPARSGDAGNDHVANFTLGTIDHDSAGSEYSDFTDLSTDLVRGGDYDVGVTLGGPKFPSNIGGLWIDWNADEDFADAGETITTAWSGPGPYAGAVTVPPTAATGATRVRVRIQDSQFDPALAPCGQTTFGEVEDYSIVVLAAACPEDLDGSGTVDFGDVLDVLAAWGPCGGCPEDLDGSGVVDFGDVLDVLAAWGPCAG